MLIWTGLRRVISAIQRLFNSASFYAPLTHSLVLERGTGSPTFTRASTATVTNNDGYLVTALAGEARFVGARRVYNKVAGNSENLTNGSWTISNTTVVASAVTPPTGVGSVSLVTCSAGTLIKQIYNTATSFTGTHIFSAYAKAGTHSVIQFLVGASSTVNFDLSAGTSATISGQSGTPSITSVGNGWYRCSMLFAAAANTTVNVLAENSLLSGRADTTASTGNFYIGGAQLEDVTAQTTQTAGEYVSVGVLSAPYHGAGVDGVEFFDTDRSGALLFPQPAYLAEGARTNKALRSDDYNQAVWNVAGGNFVATDSGIASHIAGKNWQKIEVATSAATNINQAIVATGTTETLSVHLKKGNKATDANRLGIYNQSTASDLYYVSLNYDTGAVTELFGSGSYAIEVIGTGEYRLSVTVSSGISAGNNLFVYHGYSGNPGVAGDYFYAIGSQLEAGSFASTYIPTTTAAVTRAADVDANQTASNILAAASTIYLEFTPDHTPSGTIALWGTYVDASNYTAILHDATNMIMRKRIAGVNYDATIANAFTANTTYKVCGSWGAAGVTVTLDGTEGTPHANTTAAQIAATMQWGADGNSLQQPFATERNARVWQRQLSTSERGAVTA